jgi:hypothetical protein
LGGYQIWKAKCVLTVRKRKMSSVSGGVTAGKKKRLTSVETVTSYGQTTGRK